MKDGRRDSAGKVGTVYLATGNQYECKFKYDMRDEDRTNPEAAFPEKGKIIINQWKNVETCVLRVRRRRRRRRGGGGAAVRAR